MLPSNRPGKRFVEGDGEPASASPESGTRAKMPRLDDHQEAGYGGEQEMGQGRPPNSRWPPATPQDFSSLVKTRLQSYTRTGQACDRCKVRKIRCDALPQGCSHCTNQHLECFVTDRVTGRTERRGYVQELERKQNSMLNRIHDLERLLAHHGIEVMPFDPSLPSGTRDPPSTAEYALNENGDREGRKWIKLGSVWAKNTVNKARSRSALQPRPSDRGYLGVSSDQEPLSSIKGTTLSVLGTSIDIMQFDAADVDMDEPPPDAQVAENLYNKSVQAFLQSVMNINSVPDAHLPIRKDAFQYSEWYFLMVHPFLPVIHKPSYMNLLIRIYEHGHKPTVPEEVIVHMVLATIYFQYGVRNWEKKPERRQLNALSNTHYHYALSKLFYLASSPTFESVQAMAMIAAHARSFPKPGCGILIANFAFNAAIALNLHRKDDTPRTKLEQEVRKRVWWTILCILVTLNGRLGRPMPIALEEMDVDFPEPIPDELLTDEGVMPGTGRCGYQVGLAGFKIVPLFMEMYSTIYSARRNPLEYQDAIASIEDQLWKWESELPQELRVDHMHLKDASVYALYAQSFALELRLCLRHPSMTMTDNPHVAAENTRLTEEAAHKMLLVMDELLKKKSLDTTWYQIAVYVGAIFSTLAAYWQRGSELTHADIATLRDDMKKWLDVLRASGVLLGSGKNELATRVGYIIERTVAPLVENIRRRETPADAAAAGVVGAAVNGGSSHGIHEAAAGAKKANGSPRDGEHPRQPGVGDVSAQQEGPAIKQDDAMATPFAAAVQQAAAAVATNATAPSHTPLHSSPPPPADQIVAPDSIPAWRPGPGLNPWEDWQTGIASFDADGHDRFMASSLIALGLGNDNVAIPPGGVESDWPLLLFPSAAANQGSAADVHHDPGDPMANA